MLIDVFENVLFNQVNTNKASQLLLHIGKIYLSTLTIQIFIQNDFQWQQILPVTFWRLKRLKTVLALKSTRNVL